MDAYHEVGLAADVDAPAQQAADIEAHAEDRARDEPEIQPGFTIEFLSGRDWTSSEDADRFLRALAKRIGFSLARNGRLDDRSIHYLCSMSAKSKGKEKTRKTGCEFHLWITAQDDRSSDTGIRYRLGQRFHLAHNHPLYPKQVERPLTSEVQDDVRVMRRLGLRPSMIADYVGARRSAFLTPAMIASVLMESDPTVCKNETDELYAEMLGSHGACGFYAPRFWRISACCCIFSNGGRTEKLARLR
jgi:hypothetical protein